MSKASELIGQIVDGNIQPNRVIDGEQFYTIDVSFRDTVIPVLFSSYVNSCNFENDSKVKVSGCLMSDVSRNKLPVFYFYANSIELVDIDTETTNTLNFTCLVTKVKEFGPNNRCEDILPLVASDGSPLHSTSVLFLCAKGNIARRLKDKEKGYTISGKGYLKPFRDIYEIYISHVDNLDEL